MLMNDCQKIMSEGNAALVKQRLGLSETEYAELKGQDGNVDTLSISDIVIIAEKARSGNQPAAKFLEKFRSKVWYRYELDEKMSPADLLCTVNLARSKDLPSMNRTKTQELGAFTSAHHLVDVDLKLDSPDAADILWRSMISYVVAGESAFENKTRQIEEEKKRMATVDGLADLLVGALVELESLEKDHVLQKAADHFVAAPLDTKKKIYLSMKAIGIPANCRERLLNGMMRDVDDPQMAEWFSSLLDETFVSRDLPASLQSSSDVSLYVKDGDKSPKMLAQLKALESAIYKYYRNYRGVDLSETVFLAVHKNDNAFLFEAMNRANKGETTDSLPDVFLAIDMFCVIAERAIQVQSAQSRYSYFNAFDDITIEFEAMKRLICGKLRKIEVKETGTEIINRLVLTMARLYDRFGLFDDSEQNKALASDIITMARNTCAVGATLQQCMDSFDGEYSHDRPLNKLFDRLRAWAAQKRRN